jgi:hypothetical protein
MKPLENKSPGSLRRETRGLGIEWAGKTVLR